MMNGLPMIQLVLLGSQIIPAYCYRRSQTRPSLASSPRYLGISKAQVPSVPHHISRPVLSVRKEAHGTDKTRVVSSFLFLTPVTDKK
ncbi:hypothetical protein BKA59DRAFT_462402 [Fusarium tricinctum]|uniref:Secreted protein n=1 Tax=Fusarium tricinctum TaxID=61284 RepID=A0A8K0S410_9HYPO|nr:hypothetical protein BKA59DRAFT_462402 [Fusarium tricinctum]